jgi:hypothetical protein
MFRYFIVLLSFYFTLFISYSVVAVEVKDLYQAKVIVASQERSHRRTALKEALAAVMVKVGGKKSVLTNDVFKKAISNYNLYVTQYHYSRKKSTKLYGSKGGSKDSSKHGSKPNLSSSAKIKKSLFLIANFNENKINALFQQANLPLWGSLRPQVLLWLIDEQGFERNILSSSSNSELPLIVDNFSNERGLPLLMPLMDLTDANNIRMSDFWGRFEQPIKIASERYFAEAIAIMRFSDSSLLAANTEPLLDDKTFNHNDNVSDTTPKLIAIPDADCLMCQKSAEYVLDWSLITERQKFSKRYQGVDRQALLREGLSDITELIYQHYALSTSVNNDFYIDVANVESLKSYTEIVLFLNELSAVKSVQLVSANGSMRRFNLTLLGSKSALLASLKLNKKLQQYIDPLADVTADDVPLFYWGDSFLRNSFSNKKNSGATYE